MTDPVHPLRRKLPNRRRSNKKPDAAVTDAESLETTDGLHAQIELTWVLRHSDGTAVDDRLLPLLEVIADSGSLRQAAQRLGMSYRHAWTLVQPWTAEGGLLCLSRGQGALLTEAGTRLIANVRQARTRWAKESSRWRDLDLSLSAAPGEKIKWHAIRDALLTVLPDMAARHGVQLDMLFCGSREALAALKAGQCDLAGFRAPADPSHPLHRHMAALLDEIPGAGWRPLFRRAQGLIVERGNPHKIRTLHDLARRRVYFVNRQRGSGTRTLFDALLADQQVDATEIPGYGHEEYTHAAVAAAVAAGAAQAGFGNEAAARRLDLSFVPLIEEYYFLAWRKRSTAVQTLLTLFNSHEWRQHLRGTPGYREIKTERGERP